MEKLKEKTQETRPATEAGPAATPATSGVARLNLLRHMPNQEALLLIPEALARKYQAVPIMVTGGSLEVAMANPEDINAIQALAARSKKRIEPVPASPSDILESIDFNYKAFGEINKQLDTVPVNNESLTTGFSVEDTEDAPVARVLKLVIEEGVKSRASDIHIEPEPDRLRIRYRIDGTLHDVLTLPPGIHLPLLSRIKIVANMNIADQRRPQDGQISLVVKGRDVDIRVATVYTVNGEMAVLRILDKSMAVLSLSQVGFWPESQEKYEKLLLNPYGMILVCGPTGSGKTTTLYASVNSLDRLARNIITVEDPVEYHFEGINQIQVNPKAGLTFASGLRSILRLDPDIILVGEIRDQETAQIAIQAALTGHLVLSSIHANDTVGAIHRLIDLGVEPFLVMTAVLGVVAQRMVRKICPNCGKLTTIPLVEQTAYEKEQGIRESQFLTGEGCKACVYTGYMGRTGIFEILRLSDDIRQMVLSNTPASLIRSQAIKEGMTTMVQDGMIKAKAGVTTPREVIRIAYATE